jgi:cell division protein ZipA
VVVRLLAPEGPGFEGRDVWDVMLCLGLEWGDMDCFHWINDTSFGDDFLFSVETSTEPGYFLPEEIAAGTVLVEDLVFVYSIPRSPAPVAVFDAWGAIDYVKGRLGGEVRDADGETLDVDATRRSIESDAELASRVLPGAPDTLRLF